MTISNMLIVPGLPAIPDQRGITEVMKRRKYKLNWKSLVKTMKKPNIPPS